MDDKKKTEKSFLKERERGKNKISHEVKYSIRLKGNLSISYNNKYVRPKQTKVHFITTKRPLGCNFQKKIKYICLDSLMRLSSVTSSGISIGKIMFFIYIYKLIDR